MRKNFAKLLAAGLAASMMMSGCGGSTTGTQPAPAAPSPAESGTPAEKPQNEEKPQNGEKQEGGKGKNGEGRPEGGKGGPGGMPGGAPGQSAKDIEYTTVYAPADNVTTTNGEYTSTGTDEEAILVDGDIMVTVKDTKVTRSSEDSTGGDASSFYGVGAAVLGKDSTWTVTGDSVLTNLYNAGTIADDAGRTVTVQTLDGTVLIEGTSAHTITVKNYSDSADLSGASAATSFSDYAVEKPEALK